MEAPPPVKMSVEGKGVVTLAPDVVTVSVGVRNDHATATGALAANNSAMTRVTAKVREHAREEDVKTSGLSLNPQYRHGARSSGEPELTGFTASNQLTVVLRDIAAVGDVLSILVEEGANNINGISFGSTAESAAADDARALAVRDARRKADVLAAAAGYRIAGLLKMDSHDADVQPMRMSRMAVMSEMGSVPVSGGQLEISSGVHVEYALEPM